jgi:hypothetical protein
MIEAPVLKPFSLNREYVEGEIFVKPEDYPFKNFVDLWIIGWIGDFDRTLLPDDLQELLSYPEWIELRRRLLECPQCG